MENGTTSNNPYNKYPVPPFPKQEQQVPENLGKDKPMGRAGHPVDETSYILGATIPVTGGRITI